MKKLLLASVALLGLSSQAFAACAPTLSAGANIASSATAAAGTLTATLTSTTNVYTYLNKVIVTGGGATAAAVVNGTITNVVNGPLNFAVPVPIGVAVGLTPVVLDFTTCPVQSVAPVNGVPQAITVSIPSFGAGNTLASIILQGF